MSVPAASRLAQLLLTIPQIVYDTHRLYSQRHKVQQGVCRHILQGKHILGDCVNTTSQILCFFRNDLLLFRPENCELVGMGLPILLRLRDPGSA